VCRRGCTVSPEKGGALRNQSTGGRRLGVAAIICGTLFGAPLLLLHSNASPASRSEAATHVVHASHKAVVYPASHLDAVNLPSHLVAYHAAGSTTTTTAAPVTTTTVAPVTPTTVAARAQVTTPTLPPTTTTTAPPVAANHEIGDATWYAAAPAGMCASPTLPFGTVVTVVNNATGASTVCTVDDREAAGYPRVVDLSPEGFSQIADMSEGVVAVTISW
jgi:rare lipoprotein A (peptidoglycan hydrolase)